MSHPDSSNFLPFMVAYSFAMMVFSFATMKKSGFFNFIFKIDRYSPFTVLAAMAALFLAPQYAYFGVIGVMLACMPTLTLFIAGVSPGGVNPSKPKGEVEIPS